MSSERLLENENHFVTDMGAAFVGERAVLRGKNLHQDLKDCTWFEVFIYSITGRFFKKEEMIILDALWAYTSYPDPRLWNNRVAALAASTRSTQTLGISAGVAITEATVYGTRAFVKSIAFLHRAKQAVAKGKSLRNFVKQEIKRDRAIYGYGRPINTAIDERIPAIKKLMKKHNVQPGSYMNLAFDIEKILPGQRMNYAAFCAAFASDLGFSINEFYSYTIFCLSTGMYPCYLDVLNKPEGSFFPLRSACIAYKGKARRKWKKNKNTQNKEQSIRTTSQIGACLS